MMDIVVQAQGYGPPLDAAVWPDEQIRAPTSHAEGSSQREDLPA
jgi:hypothetical protein